MTVNVTLDFPADLENRIRQESPQLEAEMREAYVLELFRQGRLSHFELSRVLGLDRFQTDALLKRRGIFEGSLTRQDLEADRQTLDRVLGKVR
jgi:predicted HTH domain antitoxin